MLVHILMQVLILETPLWVASKFGSQVIVATVQISHLVAFRAPFVVWDCDFVSSLCMHIRQNVDHACSSCVYTLGKRWMRQEYLAPHDPGQCLALQKC